MDEQKMLIRQTGGVKRSKYRFTCIYVYICTGKPICRVFRGWCL